MATEYQRKNMDYHLLVDDFDEEQLGELGEEINKYAEAMQGGYSILKWK